LGSSRRKSKRTSLVRSIGWSMLRSSGRRTLLPWLLPAHHRALVPVLPRPGVLDDAATTGLRRLRQGAHRPPGDEVVRPLPGCGSTRCATSAANRAQVSYHLTVLSIFRYKYSVVNNFMFYVLC
jgi:hypothetical protein